MSAGFQDPRVDPPFAGTERELLDGWLEFHRDTLLVKCTGLDDEQRKQRPVPTSLLSLHGLVRHMADVERTWFQRAFDRRTDLPRIFGNGAGTEVEWTLDQADWEADLNVWRAECEESRRVAASHTLDETGMARRGGLQSDFSLRWIYVRMIEEYARHNGHADLIRELVDGATGV
jgi:hypothetical protein